MYLDKDGILASLNENDIIKICTDLGAPLPKKDSQGNLMFRTICHGGDSEKLYYYTESKRFHCYIEGESFSIIELVIRARRVQGKTVTFYKALYYIAHLTGKIKTLEDINIPSTNIIEDWSWINRLKASKKRQKNIPTLTEINENILEIFCYAPHESWLEEHITPEALSRFEISYYGLTNQIVIPHRDINHRLIGIRGRFLDKCDVENVGKYLPLQISGKTLAHQLGCNLYGAHVALNAIRKSGKVLLVESEKSCLQNYSYFGEESFAVAVCGNNISSTQQKILLETLKVNEVIIGFDKEYAESQTFEAEAYYNKLVKKVAALVPYVKVSLLFDTKGLLERKDSPCDKGKEILLQLMDEKIEITMAEVERVIAASKQ